jgi:large subunit ribosomal protein L21
MEYVIVELGGKQYRVEEGDSLLVDRLEAKEGAKIAPRALLYRSDGDTVIDGADLEKVKVEAVVAEHPKGQKIRVFKYRPKKRYRRRAGHRSLLTRLEISRITGPSGRAKPAAKAAAKPADAGTKPADGAARTKAADRRAGGRAKASAAAGKSAATRAAGGKREEKEAPAKKKKADEGESAAKASPRKRQATKKKT